MNRDIKRIAIVRLSALGDIVNTAVVLQFIKKEYPNVVIEWITEEAFAPLLQGHPLLNVVHTINLKKLKKERSFPLLKDTLSRLSNLGEFDLILDIQGLLKSAIVARVIGKKTHGYDRDSAREPLAALLYNTTSNIAYHESIVKRNAFLAADGLSFEINDKMLLEKNAIFPFEKISSFNSVKKNIAIIIGASWESKKYPKELVAKLCDELQENALIVWGSEKERVESLWICENSDYTTHAPKMSLRELVTYISNCDLVIGNDTGPTHMAWAQNIPSITLFGPTNERMIYITKKNIGIKSPSHVDILKINKNDFSIKEIPTESIVTQAKELLK
jgi:heptosyltransferase-1